MNRNEKPCVRWIDVVQTVHEGKEVFVLRDPEGITEKSLLVSRDVLLVIALMDGTRSPEDIRLEYAASTGLMLDNERMASVIGALDDCYLFVNGRYEEQLERLRREHEAQPYRKACLSGKSYPDDPEALRSHLAAVMGQESGPVQPGRVVGMISPHIDYPRGSDVYGRVYRSLPRDNNTLFVVFGTSHKPTRRVWSISLKDVVTPLGKVNTAGVVGGLIAEDSLLKSYVDEWPHRNEHSIELQLPLMQFLLEGRRFEVLSILTGSLHEYMEDGRSLDRGEVPALLDRLRVLVGSHEGPVVFIAAADLAHIGAQFGDSQPVDTMLEESKKKDGELLQYVTAVDAPGFFEFVRREGDKRRICGLAPIYFALSMIEARAGSTVGYGQWTDGASSVSFAGVVFY